MQKSNPTALDSELNAIGNAFMNLRSVAAAAATNNKVSNTSYIPDDIAFSILSKLSLKSLKRFESVRKSWSLLSKNHHFMNMFRNNLLSDSYYDGASLLFNVYDKTIREDVLYSLSGERFENMVKLDWFNSYEEHFSRYTIFGFGSINGTLCHGHGTIVLWNPATQTIKHLPPSPLQSVVESSIRDVANEFASLTVYYYLHGFGYDDLINDYKVIRCVSIIGEDGGVRISLEGLGDNSLSPFWEIYSLRSNSWRKLDVDMPCSLDYMEGTQVYMDGVCHWLCEDDSPSGPCLVSFYLSNEVFVITPILEDANGFSELDALWIRLVVLNGFIALISYHETTTTFYLSILGELGIEESWTKLFIVGPLSCVERPIGVGAKEEIFFIRKDDKLVWLDLSTQMIEEVGYNGVGLIQWIIVYKEKFFQFEE